MTCLVFPDRTTCPALNSVAQARSAWAGATGAVGAAAVCAHVPTTSEWLPGGSGGYYKTLTCVADSKSVIVSTPEDHRACT